MEDGEGVSLLGGQDVAPIITTRKEAFLKKPPLTLPMLELRWPKAQERKHF